MTVAAVKGRSTQLSANTQTVRKIQDALGRGEIIETMAHFARDVRWAVNTSDRDAAPWFKEYSGRQGILAFFEDMSQVSMEDFVVEDVIGEGDVVVALLHMAFATPAGGRVDMDEAQVWRFEGGKVKSVELFPDTLAVSRAFS